MGFLGKFRKERWEMPEDAEWMKLREKFMLARKAYDQAMENFRYASPEYIDAAIAKLNEAEIYMNTILKEIKKHQLHPPTGLSREAEPDDGNLAI